MEFLFHFAFELVKISILGCVYATLTLFVFKAIGHYKPSTWFERVSQKKLRLWLLSGLCIWVGLFFFMFTYWGDHGLGDSSRVPIGHWREIQEINGMQGYIQDNDNGVNALDIDKFMVTDAFVYGIANSANENYEGQYFIYDLEKNKVKTFELEKEFEDFLATINLDTRPLYKNFSYYYVKHWAGWRFWLLP